MQEELEAIRAFYDAAASEDAVDLRVDVPPGVPAELDRTLFRQAVSNLVANALAHTPAGGSVTLSARSGGGGLRVTVADTGDGIPAEELPHVFDRFRRVDAARSRHRGGSGLGLAIVRSIARLHGGDASIESRLGEGTRVVLRLPQRG